MATVATVFTRTPWVRTPQQVIESLFPTSRPASGDAPPPPRPENKRVWASLRKGKTAVIEEVAEEMDRRDPSRSLTRLALTDGERALQDSSGAKAQRHLDFRSDACAGETLEGRLCLPRRGTPRSRPLGSGPNPTDLLSTV